jgi:serine/threonine protein kinase
LRGGTYPTIQQVYSGGWPFDSRKSKLPKFMDSGQQLFSAGSRVGQYLVLEKLGEGGMSEVFKAIEPTLERYVAIKIMHRTNMSSPR